MDNALAPATTLLSWNILEGAHDPATTNTPSPKLDDARMELIMAQVARLDPDVLVLNEALWCRTTDARVVHYARIFGYPHFICDTYDGPWGNVIMSRHPIIDQRRFRIHNRGGLVAHLDSPAGPLAVATYHPHPSRYPAHKASDFHALLHQLQGPAVVCGDFNAISPEDEPDELALAQAFARFSRHPATDASRFTEGGRRVFGCLADMGYRDAIPASGRLPTLPTDLLSRDKTSAMRIDHIWVNREVEAWSGQVLRHPDLEMASDHYPVWARVSPR